MKCHHRPSFMREASRYESPAKVRAHTEPIASPAGDFEDRLADDLRARLVNRPADPRDSDQLATLEDEIYSAVAKRYPERLESGEPLCVQHVLEEDGVVTVGMNFPRAGGITAYVDVLPGQDGGEIFVGDPKGANCLRWPQTVREAGDWQYLIGKDA